VFYRASLQVFNSLNRDQVNRDEQVSLFDVDFAFDFTTGSYLATLDASYKAATGWDRVFEANGNLSRSADDRAKYHAFRNDNRISPTATLRLNYKPSAIRLSVSGPDVPLPYASGTWSGIASGGTSPYSFRWYRNGQLVGTEDSYSASDLTSEFGLRMEVSDQYNTTMSSHFWVDVGGIRAAMTGPAVVYSSQGGGTWTASGRGGYPPYTFSWYVDNAMGERIAVGSGQSYTGYPGEGSNTLRVIMSDSNGRSHERVMFVQGIGSATGPGGCEPVPPALTCSDE